MIGSTFDMATLRKAKALADSINRQRVTFFTHPLFIGSGLSLQLETPEGTAMVIDYRLMERLKVENSTGHEPANINVSHPPTFAGVEVYELLSAFINKSHSRHALAACVVHELSQMGLRTLDRKRAGEGITSLEDALRAEGMA